MPATSVQLRVFLLWAALIILPCTSGVAGTDGIDPQDDTFGLPATIHDIASFGSAVSADSVSFTIEFYNSIAAPSAFTANSVVGYIDLDLDQNPLTGALAQKSVFSPHGDSGLGTEFHVDLFSERFHAGEAEIVDTATFQPIGVAAVTYDASTMNVRVPLALLGGDALFNYGIIVGDFLDMSDEAPNDGFATTIPEPGGLSYFVINLAIGTLSVRSRRGGLLRI